MTALYAVLDKNAVVLSGWAFSTPLWYATYVEGMRTDLTLIDDSNIVYDGWGTRQAAARHYICERPVYAIRYNDESELAPMRSFASVTPVTTVSVGWGGPTGSYKKTVYRLDPLPGTCGS